MGPNSRRAALIVSYGLNANSYAVVLGGVILSVEGRLTLTSLICEFILLGFLPLLPILIGVLRGKVDVFVSERVDRPLYFWLAVVAYFIGYLTYRLLLKDPGMAYFSLTYVVVTFFMGLLTYRWKASVHACGVSGPTTYMLINYGVPYALLYLILIPVFYARLTLEAHTLFELLLGSLAGVVFTSLTALIVWAFPQLIP